MKKLFSSALFLGLSFLFLTAVAQGTNEWTKKKAKKWFKKKIGATPLAQESRGSVLSSNLQEAILKARGDYYDTIVYVDERYFEDRVYPGIFINASDTIRIQVIYHRIFLHDSTTVKTSYKLLDNSKMKHKR